MGNPPPVHFHLCLFIILFTAVFGGLIFSFIFTLQANPMCVFCVDVECLCTWVCMQCMCICGMCIFMYMCVCCVWGEWNGCDYGVYMHVYLRLHMCVCVCVVCMWLYLVVRVCIEVCVFMHHMCVVYIWRTVCVCWYTYGVWGYDICGVVCVRVYLRILCLGECVVCMWKLCVYEIDTPWISWLCSNLVKR